MPARSAPTSNWLPSATALRFLAGKLLRGQLAQLGHLIVDVRLASLEIDDPLLDLGQKIPPIYREFLGQQVIDHQLFAQCNRPGRFGPEPGDQRLELHRPHSRAIFEEAVDQYVEGRHGFNSKFKVQSSRFHNSTLALDMAH